MFSQWGEESIVQNLIRCVEIRHKTFVEFRVEDFFESNCRFLLMKDNLQGFVIDGPKEHVQRIRQSYFYWKHHLGSECAFITRDNINELLKKSGFDEDLGILSVDIDGNDYHVLEAITAFKPRILICEYNGVFGRDLKISIPYEPDFFRTGKHYSNLYFGASLGAMTHLAEKRGCALAGANSIGSNAFYVRRDLMNDKLHAMTVPQGWLASHVRESRNEKGELNHLTGDGRLALMRGMPVLNVESGALETL